MFSPIGTDKVSEFSEISVKQSVSQTVSRVNTPIRSIRPCFHLLVRIFSRAVSFLGTNVMSITM